MSKEAIKTRIAELSKDIEAHNYNYYVLDKPTVSDYDFDMMLEELIKLEKEHPEFALLDSPTQRVGGQITKEFKSVKHKYPMLSLSNSYSTEDMEDFDRRVREGLGLSNDLFGGAVDYVCELKFDGLSIGLTYINGQLQQAVTRGDGVQGDDVTTNAKTIRSIPLKLKGHYPNEFEIRGEIFLPRRAFDQINKERE
ncbi:MAG TPA: NAD-dependent DNA ligase LigA, partial [Bacteroidia bacterium]|nr:NAD-dependent DNA ligase LigA [Bacteroidia bacterium]